MQREKGIHPARSGAHVVTEADHRANVMGVLREKYPGMSEPEIIRNVDQLLPHEADQLKQDVIQILGEREAKRRFTTMR